MRRLIILLVLAGVFVEDCRADLLKYSVPGTTLVMTLQGKTRVNPGRTVTFSHPKFGRMYIRLEDIVGRIHEIPSTFATGRAKLNRSKTTGDASQVMEAAHWLLHHGQLRTYWEAIDAALEIDPQNAEALRVMDLKRKMDVPLPEKPELEEKLRQQVKLPGFKIKRSPHFILCHDTPEKPEKGRRMNRSDERLALLELVYESFLLKFYSKGITLKIPEERLMVLLFNDHAAYNDYAQSLSPTLILAAGFWSPKTNISVFYDNGKAEQYEVLDNLIDQLREQANEARRRRGPGAADIVRRYEGLSLLVKIAKESSDVEVVSHECTHQMAGNTGLFPRDVRVPRWVHEGLAAYFEAPSDATWAGIGAVNEERLEWYRALIKNQSELSTIDFVVGDRLFTHAGSHASILHAYGQAWAMTHFLVEQRFDKLMEYYRRLGEFPPDTPIGSEVLNELFEEVFGADRTTLEAQWRDYMRGLKTDLEIILGDDAEEIEQQQDDGQQ